MAKAAKQADGSKITVNNGVGNISMPKAAYDNLPKKQKEKLKVSAPKEVKASDATK